MHRDHRDCKDLKDHVEGRVRVDLREGKGYVVLEENQGLQESREISDRRVKRVRRVPKVSLVSGGHPVLKENLGNPFLSPQLSFLQLSKQSEKIKEQRSNVLSVEILNRL